MTHTADVVVVGAGIAGVSVAYQLAVRHRVGAVALVDPRPPLTLSSDKSTECYRNWWPDAPMVGLMNHSIDLFEELATQTDFGLSRKGYLFVTADPDRLAAMGRQAAEVESLGADADVLDAADLRAGHPFLTDEAMGGVFVPRAGWFRAQDLGRWMLERARERGTRLIRETVTSIGTGEVGLSDGTTISCGDVVIAVGPMARQAGAMAGLDLPLFSELHLKVAFRDHLGVVPRDAPMTIWSDPQRIDWSDEERDGLAKSGRDDLLGQMPVFCHFRPEGGADSPYVLALWEYHDMVLEPTWPLPEDPLYPEVVLRGLTTMVPGLAAYRHALPESTVDGGYYTKTTENRPLIGPSGRDGIHLLVGLSGFGVMVSAGAADLVARHILGLDLPDYAGPFLLGRYDDPSYLRGLETIESGQL